MPRLAWLLAVSATAAMLSTALAQRADEEIVITAPLEGTRLESLQGASVLSRSDIVEKLTGNLGDLLLGTPGVSSTAYGAGAGRPIIRGLGDDRIRVLENGIGAIDASSASPDHAVGADPLDARRIEVLRGAAALAYGGNAVGGAINVIDETIPTRIPASGWSANVLAAYATVDRGRQGALGGTISADDVVFSLEISGRETADYDTPIGRMANSFTSLHAYAGGLSLVDDWGFAGLGAKRFETTYGLPPESAGEPGGYIALKQNRYEARADIEFGPGLFTRLDLAGQLSDYRHTEFEASGEPGTVFIHDGFEGRIELHNKGDGNRLTGATGLQFSATEIEAIGEEAFLTPTETRDFGIFAVQRWDVECWGFEGGLRLERRHLENSVNGKRDFTAVSGALGLFARPADGWFVGFTIARTERAPTSVELFADGPHLATGNFELGDPDLDLEIATSIEASLRYDSEAWGLDLNTYRIAFDGYVALVPTGAEIEVGPGESLPVFAFVQRDTIFTGGEISLSVRLGTAGAWTFHADVAADIVRAEFAGGGNLPRIPPRALTLAVEAKSEALDGRIELVDIAEQDDVAGFETATPGSTVLNARLTWRPFEAADVSLILDGRNLTDELVRIHSSFLKDELPRPGRSFRFAVSGRF